MGADAMGVNRAAEGQRVALHGFAGVRFTIVLSDVFEVKRVYPEAVRRGVLRGQDSGLLGMRGWAACQQKRRRGPE